MEQLITKISTTLINVAPEDIDHAIHASLGLIGEFAGVDRSYVFLFKDSGEFVDNTHEWVSSGISSEKDNLQNIPASEFQWFFSQIQNSQVVYIPKVSELPSEAAREKEEFEKESIKSLLAVPIALNGVPIGYIEFNSVHHEKIWSENDIKLLNLIAEIFSLVIDRKKTHYELKETERRYEAVVKASGQVIWEWDKETDELFFHGEIENILGFTKDELDGNKQKWCSFVHPDDLHICKEAEEKAHSNNESFSLEFRLRRKDGEYIYVENQGYHYPDSEGNLTRMVGFIRDITDRKLVEDELNLTQFAVNHSSDAIYWIRPDGSFFNVNEAACKALGYSREELLSMSVPDIYTDVSKEKWPKVWNEIKKLKSATLEFHHLKKNGEIFPVEISTSYHKYGNNEFTCSFARDISDRKKNEEILKLQAQIIDQIHDSVVSTDLDGYVTSWNKGAERLFGYTAQEALGKHISFVYPEEEHDFLQHQTIAPLKEKGKHEVETRMSRKSGEDFFAHVALSLLRDDSGEAVGMIGYSMDITERKKAEDSLRESEASLVEAQEMAKVGNWAWDIVADEVFWSDQIFRMFDITRETFDATYEGFLSFVHPKDREFVNKCVERTLYEREPYSMEHRIVLRDGTVKTVHERANVDFDDTGKPVRLYGTAQDITERKKAEIELREWKTRYDLAVESTGQLIWDWDEATNTSLYGENVESILGYKKEEIDGDLSKWFDLVHPEDSETVSEAVEQSVANREPFHLEYRIRRKDGKYIAVEDHGYFQPDAEGRLTRMVGFIRDITDRKLSEEALRESEARLEHARHLAKLGHWDWNIEPNELWWSKETYRIFNVSPDEFEPTYKSFIERVHEEDREFVVKTVDEALHEKKKYSLEFRIILSGGEVKILREDGEVELDSNGNPVRMFGIVQDITERKQTEFEIREWNNRYNLIAKASGQILYDWNPVTGDIVWDNVEDVTGYRPGEIDDLLAFWTEHVHPDDLDGFKQELDKCLNEQQTVRVDYRFRKKNGSYVILESNAYHNFDEHGNTISLVGTVQDVTELRKMEEELINAKKLDSIGVLAGGIAHDFNNLLTGIIGNISIAKMLAGSDTNISNLLTEAENVGLRAQNLTSKLLTFSKGGSPVKKVSQLPPLINDSCGIALMGSNVNVKYHMDDYIWEAEVDEGQFNQVIHNIVLNADQAMPQGGTIDVTLENKEIDKQSGLPLTGGYYVKISIQDKGLGIKAEHLEKIFDPFYTTKPDGSGLGLASAYAIVNNHGGHISAFSEVGQGTTVEIVLPAITGSIGANATTEASITAFKDDTAPTMPSRVLIMDDEKSVIIVITSMLKILGFKIDAASDGKEAIEKYSKALNTGDPFEYVIMDLTIPGGMGGKEAVGKLLEIDPDAKVLVSSGYSNDPIMSDFREYGFKGVLTKPYTIRDLKHVLNSLNDA